MEKQRFLASKTMLLGICWIVFLAAFLLVSAKNEKSEPFTELYYNTYKELPQNIQLNQTYNFSFNITNRETEEQTYLVRVSAEYAGKKKSLLSSDVVVGPDQSRSIPVSFNINESFSQAKIAVRLDNLGNEIHFWAEEEK